MSRIVLVGATGLIGGALLARLAARGHAVDCPGRRPPVPLPAGCTWVDVDVGRLDRAGWVPLLATADVVVNAVGIFRERGEATFERLHVALPRALFEACRVAGVARVIQVSALGADAGATTAYHRSKFAADEHVLSLGLDATVVQPSLVFSADGASSRRFLAMAAGPVLALPGGGRQAVQPVHLDDVVSALATLVRQGGGRVPLVGPRATTLRAYLLDLRAGMGLRPCPVVPVPRPLVALAARVGDRRADALFDSAAWSMLARGNTAPAEPMAQLLGAPPRAPRAFVAPAQADDVRHAARLAAALPWLRLSLAFVWFWTAYVSAFVYPREASLALLAQAGVPAALGPLALYGAAALDAVFGVLTLWPLGSRSRLALWAAQAALILGYTVIITFRLPEYWAHPYGPLSKNVPMLALLWLLWALEPRRHVGLATIR